MSQQTKPLFIDNPQAPILEGVGVDVVFVEKQIFWAQERRKRHLLPLSTPGTSSTATKPKNNRKSP